MPPASPGEPPPAARAFPMGIFTPSVVLELTRRTGRLAGVGLAVSEDPVVSSPAQFRSLLAGEYAAALTSPDNVLAYRFNPRNPLGETSDVRIVGAVDRGMGLGLYGRPGMVAEQLRGTRIGVDVPTSGFALALYALADSLGVRREEYDLVPLGSTPQRLRALIAGECGATMLNAGNELLAEAAGCPRLASTVDVATPYLGTVVAVAGDRHLSDAHRLCGAVRETAEEIVAGRLGDEARGAARELLGLDDELARRYVERLRDPDEGLVPDGTVDRASLETLVGLRTRYLPEVLDGADVLAGALDDPGLLAPGP